MLNLGMRWRGQLMGLLLLAWRDEVTIPESTLHTLEALMTYQAAAIENARTRMLLETRARLAHTLLEFSGRALTTTDEHALQQLILDTACLLACGDRSRYLIEQIDDAPADSQVTAAARVGGYGSIAIMPLQHGGTSTGLLIVALLKPHQWNSEEVEALQTLAQVSSEALERCRVQLAEVRERRRLDSTLEHLYRSAHSSGQHKGMGLGLHITSEIVHRHGGTIRVVSEPGVGSTFFVELPRGL